MADTARLRVCGDAVEVILSFGLHISPRRSTDCSAPSRIVFSKFFRCQGFRWDHDESALKTNYQEQ